MTSSTRNSSVQATRKTARETAREVASETTCRTAHKASCETAHSSTHKTSRKASSRPSESGSAFCPVEKKCGGCQLLQIPYEKQLEQKQEEMFRLFKPFSNPHTIFSPIFGMDEPFYYRNKVTSLVKSFLLILERTKEQTPSKQTKGVHFEKTPIEHKVKVDILIAKYFMACMQQELIA